MSMFRTSQIADGDLVLTQWTIIELPKMSLDGGGIDCHFFGYSSLTELWHLSSLIHEETHEYAQTRSRKYFKAGPQTTSYGAEAIGQLSSFLNAWRVDPETIEEVIRKMNVPL